MKKLSKAFGLEEFALNTKHLQKLKGGEDAGGLCVIDNFGGRTTEDDSGGLCVVDNVDL